MLYVDYNGNNGKTSHFLAFDDAFKAILPIDWQEDESAKDEAFDAIILDTKTGIEYKVKKNYPCYEIVNDIYDPESESMVSRWTLHQYTYAGHWCGCHRWSDVEASNPEAEISDEVDCPRNRFLIKRLTHESNPEIVLMYEDKV